MNYLLTVFQFVIAIPKIIKFYREMKSIVDENKHDKAIDEYKKAKTEQEKKDALRGIADNM